MKPTFLSFFLMALGTCTAWAGSICPAGNGGNPFPHSPDAAGTGCNVVITINADRTSTVTILDTTAYENSEDVLVGVKNNSSSSVPSFSLTGSGIFGLEGDGICIYTFVGSSYCTASQIAGTDPGDYYGPNTTFVITNASTGTVNFTAPIPAGGSSYCTASQVAGTDPGDYYGPNTTTTPTAAGVPALSVWAILLLASMLMGYSLWAIRKNRQHQE